MGDATNAGMVTLDTEESIWERFYTVFPLVVVGTREVGGEPDLAPKHLAMPVSWKNHFAFVCTPRHNTYQNILREKEFAVTYIRPDQAVLASLAASPRCDDGSKPVAAALPLCDGVQVSAPLVEGGYLHLECRLERMVDDLDENALIIGRIVTARVARDALRGSDRDDQDLVHDSPLMAYLYPGRFAAISASCQLPLPAGFKR